MNWFKWVASSFLLRHLRIELIVTLIVLLVVIAATAMLVGIELKKEKKINDADK